jgi:rSAM/selenodomain-associated transferase 2
MSAQFSIIIPVIHEETIINSTIERLVAFHPSISVEIIVVDGDREGKTIGVIRNGNVKTAVAEKGRGNQMNRGAAMAQGKVVIFLHADTCLPPDAFTLIEAALNDPACMAGAFDLAIASGRPIYRLIAKIASFRSRLTRIPYGDQAFFFRRVDFLASGGFANIPLMEDVEIMRRIKKRGGKVAIINRHVTTSARRWEKEGIILCTLRNWFSIALYLLGISPERLSKLYKQGF